MATALKGPNSLRLLGLVLIAAVSMAAVTGGLQTEVAVADAAQRGDADLVRSLLREGADVNGAQPDGMTALHWAARENYVEIAQLLLYAGATLKARTRLGAYTPLHLASRGGHTSVVKTPLEAGADPNLFTSTGVTALHFAAEADAAEVVEAILGSGGDVNALDGFSNRTPLMFAAVRGANLSLQALLDGGADASISTLVKDHEELSRMDRLEQDARERVIEAALAPKEDSEPEESALEEEKEPAEPTEPTESEPTAEEEGEAENEPEAEEEMEEPETPVLPAPESQIKALSSMQQIGKQGGFTALHYAARQGFVETAQLLVEGGAQVNQVTGGDQSSAMLVATINGNYDLARELLERGADPNLVSDDGVAPLFAALNIEWSLRTWYPQPSAFRQQATTYLDLMRLLLEAGADSNERTTTHVWYAAYNAGRMGVDFTGATPFWRAAYARDVRAMKLLVEFDADPNIWTIKLPPRVRFGRNNRPRPPREEDEEDKDKSGLPPTPVGGRGIHPLHAASGVGFGTSRVAQQHRAVPGGALPSLQYMIEELGVDADLRDMGGYGALHHSAARGDNETILYLVSQGADVMAVSRKGETTADFANSPEQRAQPLPETIALLEELGSVNNHNCKSCGASR